MKGKSLRKQSLHGKIAAFGFEAVHQWKQKMSPLVGSRFTVGA